MYARVCVRWWGGRVYMACHIVIAANMQYPRYTQDSHLDIYVNGRDRLVWVLHLEHHLIRRRLNIHAEHRACCHVATVRLRLRVMLVLDALQLQVVLLTAVCGCGHGRVRW